MARVFTVSFTGVAVTAQQDFFEITAAAAKPLRILGLTLGQTSEVGDAQEEQLSILVKRGQTTSGSGGSAATPALVKQSIGAASFSAEVNNTVKASGGTIVTLHADAWNVRGGFNFPWPPEMQIEVAGGERCTVELATTPGDSITMNGTLYVEEVG